MVGSSNTGEDWESLSFFFIAQLSSDYKQKVLTGEKIVRNISPTLVKLCELLSHTAVALIFSTQYTKERSELKMVIGLQDHQHLVIIFCRAVSGGEELLAFIHKIFFFWLRYKPTHIHYGGSPPVKSKNIIENSLCKNKKNRFALTVYFNIFQLSCNFVHKSSLEMDEIKQIEFRVSTFQMARFVLFNFIAIISYHFL